jgi:hypothetical protein
MEEILGEEAKGSGTGVSPVDLSFPSPKPPPPIPYIFYYLNHQASVPESNFHKNSKKLKSN